MCRKGGRMPSRRRVGASTVWLAMQRAGAISSALRGGGAAGDAAGPGGQAASGSVAEAIVCEKRAKGEAADPGKYAGTLHDCLQQLYKALDALAGEAPSADL